MSVQRANRFKDLALLREKISRLTKDVKLMQQKQDILNQFKSNFELFGNNNLFYVSEYILHVNQSPIDQLIQAVIQKFQLLAIPRYKILYIFTQLIRNKVLISFTDKYSLLYLIKTIYEIQQYVHYKYTLLTVENPLKRIYLQNQNLFKIDKILTQFQIDSFLTPKQKKFLLIYHTIEQVKFELTKEEIIKLVNRLQGQFVQQTQIEYLDKKEEDLSWVQKGLKKYQKREENKKEKIQELKKRIHQIYLAINKLRVYNKPISYQDGDPLGKIFMTKEMQEIFDKINELILKEFLRKNLKKQLQLNFVYSKELAQMNLQEIMDQKIEEILQVYFNSKKKSIQNSLDYTLWINEYVTRLKRVGFFKSAETFEFFEILKNSK